MSNYTICCVGFEPQQQASIGAILDLAGSALNNSWSITDHVDGDVFMINMSSESGVKNLIERQDIPCYRIIQVAEKAEDNTTDHWFLAKKEFGPPSLRELIQLLNQVDVCLLEATVSDFSEKMKLQIESDIEDHIEETEEIEEIEEIELQSVDKKDSEFSIDLGNAKNKKLHKPSRKLTAKNYLFGMLLQAKKDKNTRIIKSNNLPPLYVWPQKGCCFFSGTEPELTQFCIASTRKINDKPISDTKFNKLLNNETNSMAVYGLDALIGFAIVIASQGRLLEGQLAEQIVKLNQQPSFDEIPVFSEFKAISELMIEQKNNLFDVAEQLQLPLSDVFNFYNICYFFEYIKVITPPPTKLVEEKAEITTKHENSKTLGNFLTSFFNK